MEAYTYKGISQGKYVEGEIEALNQDEASFKLKEQQIIITNLKALVVNEDFGEIVINVWNRGLVL